MGMSDILGPLRYSENEEDVFLGRSVTQRKSMSDETAKLIDNEIRGLIDKAENHARKLLKKHIKHLHNLAKALLEFETLSGDDVDQLIKRKIQGVNQTQKIRLIEKPHYQLIQVPKKIIITRLVDLTLNLLCHNSITFL